MTSATEATDVSLSGQALTGAAAKLVTIFIGFLGTILFARVLGPTGFGAFYLLLAVSDIVLRPIMGWTSACKKRLSEDVSASRRSKIMGSQTIAVAILSVAILAIGAAAADLLTEYVGLEYAWLYLGIICGTTGLSKMATVAVEARGQVGVSMWAETARTVTKVFLQASLVVAGLGVTGMVSGYVAGTILLVPVLLYVAKMGVSAPSRDVVEDIWEFARYSIPQSFLGQLYTRFDLLLIGALLTTAAAGHYEVAFRLTMPAIIISTVIGASIQPRVSRLDSQDRDASKAVSNSIAFASALAIPLFFGAVVIATETVVTIYGPEYRPAGILLVGLALYRVFYSQTAVITSAFSGWDRPDLILRISAIALVVNVVLGVVLLLQYGAIGVVVATIISEALRYGVAVSVAADRLDWQAALPRPIFEQIGAAAVMAGAVYGLLSIQPVEGIVTLLAIVGAGATLYGLILLTISQMVRTTALEALQHSPAAPLLTPIRDK